MWSCLSRWRRTGVALRPLWEGLVVRGASASLAERLPKLVKFSKMFLALLGVKLLH